MTPWHFDIPEPRSRSGWALALDLLGIAVACALLLLVGFTAGLWAAGEPTPRPASWAQPTVAEIVEAGR